jgi:hypothetical protein
MRFSRHTGHAHACSLQIGGNVGQQLLDAVAISTLNHCDRVCHRFLRLCGWWKGSIVPMNVTIKMRALRDGEIEVGQQDSRMGMTIAK